MGRASRIAGGIALLVALAAAPAGAQGVDVTCSLTLTRTDAATLNVAYPDEAAIYWVGGYQAVPGTRLRIEGGFPRSRYMSFNVYDQAQRPLDAIADVELRPDAGSANPFLPGAKRGARARAYTAFVEFGPRPEKAADRAPNTIYTGTGQNGAPNLNGSFIYRIYIPDRGLDDTGGMGLPTVTLEAADGGPAPRSACADLTKPGVPGVNEQVADSDATVPEPSRAVDPPRWRKFVNLLETAGSRVDPAVGEAVEPFGGSGGFLSNVHNAYVAVDTNRQLGGVLVTRVRAPSFPDTRGGAGAMPGGQVRYFSMCQNHLVSQRFVACRTDDQTVVGPDGFATYVVSTPAQRPANATAACGVTWLPWGPSQAGLLILRHMLPRADFTQSIQSAKQDEERRTMGDYFPTSRYYADRAAFEKQVGCVPPRHDLGLPRRACPTRRRLSFRLRRPGGARLRAAQVRINGRTVRRLRGAALRRRVVLRAPRGRFRLTVIARTASGRRVVNSRVYRGAACPR